jgi:hypothetical protein
MFFSCKKDPKLSELSHHSEETHATNDVLVRFTNVMGNSVLELVEDVPYTPTTTVYFNANNDTFSVSTLRYYISNVRLKKADGTYYTEVESYHLIDASDTTNKGSFTLKNVPADNYISIEFLLGVDSARNCSGAQTGALDATNDMFWDWNQGYIFFKFEGYSTKAPPNTQHNVTFHVGGFSGQYNSITKFNCPFPGALAVHEDHASTVFMKANIQECFMNPDTIKFDTYNFATSGASSKFLVKNYADMFTVSAIKH